MFALGLLLALCALISSRTVSAQCVSEGTLQLVPEGSVRLISVPSLALPTPSVKNAGRLEICRNGIWGTIQTESAQLFWSEKNILVACRQLGYDGALNSVPSAQLTPSDHADSSVPVHYASVTCTGIESNITDCSLQERTAFFSHTSDAYLVCWPNSAIYNDLHSNPSSKSRLGDIRLVGHPDNGRGAVEISTSLGWSTICPDSNWTNSDADIVCQLLGYSSGTVITLALNSSRVDMRLVRDAQCVSVLQPASLTRIGGGYCSFQATGSNFASCGSPAGTYAGVLCSTSSAPMSSRLFGLDSLSNNRLEGVVEYLIDNRWGVMCRPTRTTDVSQAVCDGLGYNPDEASLVTVTSTVLGNVESRMKPLWIPNMVCDASDTSLSQCILQSPLGFGTCGTGRDILVVDCGPKNRSFPTGYIAAIVVPSLILVGAFIFLIVKKDEWLPKLRAAPWFQNLMKIVTCQCLQGTSRTISSPSSQNYPSANVRRHSIAEVQVDPAPEPGRHTRVTNVEENEEPAATGGASIGDDASTEEPTLNKSELSKPAPPPYRAAFGLPNPNEDLPPPYSAHTKGGAQPSAPPPVSYSIPQGGHSAYPPPASNPAYPPPAGNPGYLPPTSNPAYPPPNLAYPPPDGNLAYPPPASSSAYPPTFGLPYPTSTEDQISSTS